MKFAMQRSQEEENNGFGPMFKQRGSAATWASIFILILFIALSVFFETLTLKSDIWMFYFCAVAFSLLAYIIGEFLRRICLSAEEFRHRRSRYGGSASKAFTSPFDFQNFKLVGLISFVAVLIAFYSYHQDHWKYQYLILFLLNAIFIPIFVFLFGLREPSAVEHSQTNEKENKNLADGLAWSYYFGYLKFVLPELTNQINLTEGFRNKINVHKVFIVIPKNCFVFDKISNPHSDPKGLVKCVGNLEPLMKNRGGILKRSYQHSVHCIVDEMTKEEYYCVMEYATPLMTLHEMSDDPKAGLSREERDCQVNLFVCKLKAILDEDINCKDKYELVTLGREDQEIGKIIIRTIKNSAVEIGYK